MSDKRTILVLTSGFPPGVRGGGTIRSVHAALIEAADTYETMVITSAYDIGATHPLPVPLDRPVPAFGTTVVYTSRPRSIRLLTALWRSRRIRPRCVYLNSFFNPWFSILGVALWTLHFWGDATMLLAPRGEFGSGALGRHAFRKRLHIGIFRRLGLHHRVVWHVSSPQERQDLLDVWGPGVRVVVRPDDTLLPDTSTPAPMSSHKHLRLAFIARIADHKGLHVVLSALEGCSGRVDLDIFGPEEDRGYLNRCRAIIVRLPAQVQVRFRGVVDHQDVRGVLNEHDAIVLPTKGENFCHVIGEALSVSCFVLATPWTPWSETLSSGGGIVVVDRSVEEWRAVLERLSHASPSEIRRYRTEAGRAYERWVARREGGHLFDLIP